MASCSRLLIIQIAFLTILLTSCSYFVSWDEKSQMLIERPIEVYTRLNGQPDEIKELSNGNKEYKYWLKELDPSCIHYWIVNPEGIIVDYRYEGRCRPIG